MSHLQQQLPAVVPEPLILHNSQHSCTRHVSGTALDGCVDSSTLRACPHPLVLALYAGKQACRQHNNAKSGKYIALNTNNSDQKRCRKAFHSMNTTFFSQLRGLYLTQPHESCCFQSRSLHLHQKTLSCSDTSHRGYAQNPRHNTSRERIFNHNLLHQAMSQP